MSKSHGFTIRIHVHEGDQSGLRIIEIIAMGNILSLGPRIWVTWVTSVTTSEIDLAFLRYFAAFVVLVVVLYFIVVRFSAVESRYKCTGEALRDGIAVPTEIFIKLNEYRWWVSFWSDSAGSLHTEIPNELVRFYGDLTEVGDQFQIMGYQNKLVGNFSNLSKTLALDTFRGFFDGNCVAID